jgi:hypothetical protein
MSLKHYTKVFNALPDKEFRWIDEIAASREAETQASREAHCDFFKSLVQTLN